MKINTIIKVFWLICIMLSTCNANALTATTAQTIQGNKPYLYADGGIGTPPAVKDDVLYFKYNDGTEIKTFYGDSTTSLAATKFPASLTINDFDTTYLGTGNWENYDDIDGDELNTVTTDSYSKVLIDFYERELSSTDTLNPCFGPYTLKLTAENVVVKSKYGFPHEQSLTNLEKPFTINVQEEPTLCFLKPKSMAWFGWNGSSKVEHWNGAADSSLPVRDSVQGGGVTSDFFITKGFIGKPTQPIGNVGNFPTTGFTGAEFIIEMLPLSGGSSYGLSSNNSEVKITPINAYQAKVKFYNKFTDANIHITQGSWSMDYPIKIQTWAAPRFIGVGANNAISYADAQTYCGGLNNILTRAEFTNTPRALSSGWLVGGPNTLFTRAIGSITGEWGRLSNTYSLSYGDSLWIGGYYWTSDTYGTAPNNIFVSGVTYGSIVKEHSPDIDTDSSGTPSGPYVACRG